MSWLDSFFQTTVTVDQAGTVVGSRAKINFIGATVADNPAQQRVDITVAAAAAGSASQIQYNNAGNLGGVPIAFNGTTTLTSTRDAKLTSVQPETHVSTSSTTLTTLYTCALAGITGAELLRGVVAVTDSTGVNVAFYQIDAGYRLASGTPTNVYGSTVTNLGKNGTLAGTEVTLAISGTNVLIQVTAPSASALTWSLHGFEARAIA